jgi:hypothetical protein
MPSALDASRAVAPILLAIGLVLVVACADEDSPVICCVSENKSVGGCSCTPDACTAGRVSVATCSPGVGGACCARFKPGDSGYAGRLPTTASAERAASTSGRGATPAALTARGTRTAREWSIRSRENPSQVASKARRRRPTPSTDAASSNPGVTAEPAGGENSFYTVRHSISRPGCFRNRPNPHGISP